MLVQKTSHQKALVNVLGVVYLHSKTEDGGDLYLTRHAESHQQHLEVENWYEESWFTQHRVRLLGTSSVYRVPTKPVDGTSLDLVVKHNRVGEDVPLNTHTLQEFTSSEFNSPWEEFSLVMEMGDKRIGQRLQWIRVARRERIKLRRGRRADRTRCGEARERRVADAVDEVVHERSCRRECSKCRRVA